MSISQKESFFNIGTQYYIAARFSALSRLLPVSGNLFHHAIEMYFKGYLVTKFALTDLKSLGHRLPDI